MKTKIISVIVIATILFACTKPNPNLVSITGKITNPLGASVGFIGKDTTYVTNINDNGTFEITFSLDSSTNLDFDHGIEQAAMYVYPGDKIKLTIDPVKFNETITYEGSPTSSFLAKKLLWRENTDFYGKVYYLGSPAEYKTLLDEYKASLFNAFGAIEDSFFIKREMAYIDNSIARYVSEQEKISEYEKDIRVYMMEWKILRKKYDFKTAVDSLNSGEFDNMLNAYSNTLNSLLSEVTNKEYTSKVKENTENGMRFWRDRKTFTDNMPKQGEPAIDFTYHDMDGNEFSLSSFKGNLVYVDVWATWCGPCIAQIPALKKLEKEYHGKNITFLSVSIDEDKEAWLKMVAEEELGGIQLRAGEAWVGDGLKGIAKHYAIYSIPRFMLFSVDGTVISTDAPKPASGEIKRLLDSNL
jgi:thiol-disulfide isomerase/thioredoxin